MPSSETYLIEVSWEVCNKVGGIHTVVSSKADEVVAAFGDRYLTVGPLMPQSRACFEEEEIDPYSAVARALRHRGIDCKLGRWTIPSRPPCLLIDLQGVVSSKDKILYVLWEQFGVDSMFGQWDYVEPVLFSTACGMAVEEVASHVAPEDEIVAHFHEWMTGAGLLHLRQHVPDVSTVFTTHATVLGRAISGTGDDLYARLPQIDPKQEARRHNVAAKHSMEVACAREADCFTAVSGITAKECQRILGTPPQVVTPNGFPAQTVTEFARDKEAFASHRQALLDFASTFLQRPLPPERTRIVSISGRYEFHNKGIDVLVEALGTLEREWRKEDSGDVLLTFFLVLGGYVGAHDETRLRMQQTFSGLESGGGIVTHHLGDFHNDPLLKALREQKLANAPETHCPVIFVPVCLDGNDGLLNLPYYDALAGCDLGVYPSCYEPWGYTPQESVAYSVPAITTDKAGFGLWIQDHHGDGGVTVLEAQGKSDAEVMTQLVSSMREFLEWDEDTRWRRKRQARGTSLEVTWQQFFAYYHDAYAKALGAKQDRVAGLRRKGETDRSEAAFVGTNSLQPRLRSFSVVSPLPAAIQGLRELAYGLWWVWKQDVEDLFVRLDPLLWERTGHNPVAMLQMISAEKAAALSTNEAFLARYETAMAQYRAYVGDTKPRVPGLRALTWKRPVAYFSMEFGIHECMPGYSGGLGVLSGDHLKSASDMAIPMVALGLLYKFGYFSQRINRDGEQVVVYEECNFARMPIQIVHDRRGQELHIDLDLPGRTVRVRAWEARVGRIRLFLLDPDVEENSRRDREIASRLYDSSTRERIEQEILLGIGGARLLQALAIEPSVYHMNEGHSAFLTVELIRDLMEEAELDFDTAREVVRSRTAFTTHTPVPAGNERFDRALVGNYFGRYIESSKMTWDQFWSLGHQFAGEDSDFEMTVLALRLSAESNAVSRLHGEVARGMWQGLWPGCLPEEVPIRSITNGVHFCSWICRDMAEALQTYAGISCAESLLEPAEWERIRDMPAGVLWRSHKAAKNKLFDMILEVVQHQWSREGEDPVLCDRFRSRLNPAALTIGFARRFATYKRPALLFSDIERLRTIVTNADCPVQIVFAGKAHPADPGGSALIKQIVSLSKEPDFLGRIIFIENYNIRIARRLVAGVDVWLNNPIRLMEASGTSGMKAAINGVINCSILDGWWDEAYMPGNGWAIGSRKTHHNQAAQDRHDVEGLYDVIEQRIVPMFYDRSAENVPDQWVGMMKNTMTDTIPRFNCNRMLEEYARLMYEPLAKYGRKLAQSNWERARTLAEWKRKIPGRFSKVRIRDVHIAGLEGDVLDIGRSFDVTTHIEVPGMTPEEIQVQLVVEDMADGTTIQSLSMASKEGPVFVYSGSIQFEGTGHFRYGVRVVPVHPDLMSPLDTGLVVWG